jgi:hypothetical protein
MAKQDTPTFASFNPTGNETVQKIKDKTDDLIALIRLNTPEGAEAGRRAALAITNYEQAAMWAVKAQFS